MTLRRSRPFWAKKKAGGGGSTLFISTWNTANTSTGSSASNQVKLPLVSTGTYDFTVDWGDGNEDVITTWNQAEVTHTYASIGTYIITISGTITGWNFGNLGDKNKITEISQWGPVRFISNISPNNGDFRGCTNLNVVATDTPDFTGCTAIAGFFYQCTALIGNSSFENWNISGITNISHVFSNCTNFNANLTNWDVSSVTIMDYLFNQCAAFNGNITSWNVSNVITFRYTFSFASSFNQNINGWNVSSCTSLEGTFWGASAFNQNISFWNVSAVTIMFSLFRSATAFNQNLGSWNVSNCTDFRNFMLGKTAANFSAANLDAIYNGWSALPTLSPNEAITFGTAKYTATGQAGRDILTGTYGWTITDGGI